MENRAQSGDSHGIVPIAILAVVAAYGFSSFMSWPQHGTQQIVEQQLHHAGDAAVVEVHAVAAPPFWTVIPFVLLLAGIAVLPLIPATAHWWESNLNRFKLAGGLARVTLAYYAYLHNAALEGH